MNNFLADKNLIIYDDRMNIKDLLLSEEHVKTIAMIINNYRGCKIYNVAIVMKELIKNS